MSERRLEMINAASTEGGRMDLKHSFPVRNTQSGLSKAEQQMSTSVLALYLPRTTKKGCYWSILVGVK